MAVRGITFNKQLLKSEDFAHQTNYFYQGKMGVTKGCEISTNVDGNLVVSDGYFMIFGRQVANVGDTIVEVPVVASGTLYSKLVFTIDLTLENTISEFNQGYFEIISNSVTYPPLIQEDLDNGGTKYQIEFYKFDNTVSGITNGTDTRTLLDLSMYALGEDLGNVDSLKTTAKTVVGAINEQNDSLTNIGSNIVSYVYKSSNLSVVAEYNKSTKILKCQVSALQVANDTGLANLFANGSIPKPTIDITCYNGILVVNNVLGSHWGGVKLGTDGILSTSFSMAVTADLHINFQMHIS